MEIRIGGRTIIATTSLTGRKPEAGIPTVATVGTDGATRTRCLRATAITAARADHPLSTMAAPAFAGVALASEKGEDNETHSFADRGADHGLDLRRRCAEGGGYNR